MTKSAVQRKQDQTDEATEWLARLRAHDVGERDRVRFVEWFADARNRAAFDEVLSLWERLQCVAALNPRH
jgi:ferric-dicitrate binding protein FerR (iron transport regulator)